MIQGSVTSCASASCHILYFDKPTWQYGYSAAVIGVTICPNSVCGTVPLWQRVCMASSCGFVASSANSKLGIKGIGAPVKIRFATETALYLLNSTTDLLNRVQGLSGADVCAAENCRSFEVRWSLLVRRIPLLRLASSCDVDSCLHVFT